MTAQGETVFKRQVLNDLKKRFGTRAYVLKTQERGRRGVPDLLICLAGDFVAIELKIDGEKPDPLQTVTLDRIIVAGGYAFSTTPMAWPAHLEILQAHWVKKNLGKYA